MRITISVERELAVICGKTEEQMRRKLRLLKDRYTEVVRIDPAKRGCYEWIAWVRPVKEKGE